MKLPSEENFLIQFESPEAIGDWLLTGFYNWPNYEKPWIQAFSPLPLYDDLNLERQLVKHFSLSIAEHLVKALLWSLGQWIDSVKYSEDEHSSRVLKGLLNMVVEVKQTERFKSVFGQLLTDTPKAVHSHMKIVNVLATLAPDPVAIALLNDFRNAKQWKPDFAPLTYIAYITHKPEDWVKDLQKFRDDFNKESKNGRIIKETKDGTITREAIKETLKPQIFFAYVMNTIGINRIAAKLKQLELSPNEFAPDQWFIEALLGKSDSPLLALKDHNDKWYLTKYIDYPTGEKAVIETTNEDLEVYLKSYNNDKICEFLTTKVVTLYVEEKITIVELDKAIDDLAKTFSQAQILHYLSRALENTDNRIQKPIKELLDKFAKKQTALNLSKLEQNILIVIRHLSTEGYLLTQIGITQLLPYIFQETQIDFGTSNAINKAINKMIINGFLLSKLELKQSLYYADFFKSHVKTPANTITQYLSETLVPILYKNREITLQALSDIEREDKINNLPNIEKKSMDDFSKMMNIIRSTKEEIQQEDFFLLNSCFKPNINHSVCDNTL